MLQEYKIIEELYQSSVEKLMNPGLIHGLKVLLDIVVVELELQTYRLTASLPGLRHVPVQCARQTLKVPKFPSIVGARAPSFPM